MSEVIKHTTKLWERDGNFLYWCPGCKYAHSIPVPRWSFNGDHTNPTFAPSVRHFTRHPETGAERTLCHYHVQCGKIQYCGDCEHELNGQVVDMVDIPADYGFH